MLLLTLLLGLWQWPGLQLVAVASD